MKFLSMLKELSVNIPLLEALKWMSSYAKLMKDLVTRKCTVSYDPIDNVHHYSVAASKSLVEMKDDPRAFAILCTIQSFNFAPTLYDLGDSINLIPLFVFKQLGIGPPN